VSVAGPPHDVRRASIRVALGTTAAVATVYVVVAVAFFVIVSTNLTRQVDDRLTSALTQSQPPTGGSGDEPPEGPHDRPLGPPVLAWLVRADGTVLTTVNASLPTGETDVTGPTTTTINGTQIRIAGTDIAGGHLVVGQDITDIGRTQSNLVLAELLIGPVLLVFVFGGAVFVGRRVATPIEVARRRQLDFSADASHELRTPLSVIEANTSLALSEPRTAAWYRTAFERVSGESARMRRLLDDLLWLSRFDARHGQPDAEPVDLGILAAQAVDRFHAIAEARHLALTLDAPEGQVITAPPDWLDRLLGVLLDNACKYSPEDGMVTVSVQTDGGRVTLTVDDGGPGIPDDQRERIFDRFHRATESGSGAGLGLAIANEVVRATGGRWRLESAPQGGARMSVSWPRGRLAA
jgi:two-component system, OmpR family, sensor histidine kinase CiaH